MEREKRRIPTRTGSVSRVQWAQRALRPRTYPNYQAEDPLSICLELSE